ncbi:MAG: hypothetical protein Q9160_003053 [Pyrenula sp. 1 TL-2023]
MNNTAHSLNILLPTLNCKIPRELSDLSQSLLAQSRIRAPHLKAEEEIARPYACAEIACKRISSRLRLPRLAGRPPCTKTVYKKLLGLLEHVLATTAKHTPTKEASRTNNAARVSKSPGTPTPARSGRRYAAAGADTPSKKKTFAGKIGDLGALKDSNKEAPDFVMPFTRQLCAAISAKSLAPHVYTGVCTIIRLAEVDTAATDAREEVLTLAIVVFFIALTKGSEMDPETYVTRSESALSMAGLDAGVRNRLDEWVKRISENEWSQGLEWWDNIPESALSGEMDVLYGFDDDDGEVLLSTKRKRATYEDELKDGLLLPGLGTMLQEQNDWLSEDKQHQFERWKNDVFGRTKRSEKSHRRTLAAA